MRISTKTRKTLWGKSGNRCPICKVKTEEEASAIAVFFKNIEDYGDLMGMESFSNSAQVGLGLQFNNHLHLLDALVFWVFGERCQREVTYEDAKSSGIWEDIAVLHLVLKSSPNIVKR